jgi:hypothetical protein
MFKRNVEYSGKSTVFQFAFKIFFIHILNVPIMLLISALSINLNDIGIAMSDNAVSAIFTVVCFLFYTIFLYIEAWRTGERDHNLVLYGRISYQKSKAFAAALVSQIPGIFFGLVLLTGVFGADFTADASRYARYFYLNFNYPIRILDDLYGFDLVYLIPVLFAVIPAIVGYYLGYKGRRFLTDSCF